MILRIFLSGGKEAEYGSNKIAIVCDGKEISYALNLLHLFQYKNEIEEFNSDNYKEASIEMYSAAAFGHAA